MRGHLVASEQRVQPGVTSLQGPICRSAAQESPQHITSREVCSHHRRATTTCQMRQAYLRARPHRSRRKGVSAVEGCSTPLLMARWGAAEMSPFCWGSCRLSQQWLLRCRCPEADTEQGVAGTCTVASVAKARMKVSWRSFCFR